MRKKLMAILCAVSFIWSYSLAADEKEQMKGIWSGEVTISPQSPILPIEVVLEFEKAWSGTLLFTGKSSNPQPLHELVIEDNDISFELKSSPKMSFKGELVGGEIIGIFNMGLPVKSTFRLVRKTDSENT